MESLFFGDIFRQGDEEFVYLVGVRKFTYAARIFNREVSRRIDDERNGALMRNASGVNETPRYGFVMLRTPAYEGRAANYGMNPELPTDDECEKTGTLIPEDKKELMEEICHSDACPLLLKEFVQEIKSNEIRTEGTVNKAKKQILRADPKN